MEEGRYFGTIFFPNTPEEKIPGVWLIIKNNSILLETPLNSYSTAKWDIILGEFTGIDKITFVNCYSGGSSLGAGGHHLDILVSYIIKDFHALKESDLAFKKIALSSPVLTKWITDQDRITHSSDYKTFQIPEKKEIVKVVIDNLAIIINLSYSISYGLTDLHINKTCFVIIESESLVGIEVLDKLMSHLKKLILFLTNKNPEFNKYAVSQNGNERYELINTRDNLNEDAFTRGIHITYWDIKDSFPLIIKRWFEFKELQPIIDLVLERCFNTGMSRQGFYLSICMAIEIFQNNFGESTEEILDPSVIQNRENIFKKIEDEKLRNWFMDKSKHWNNPTFRDRLMEFEAEIEEIISGVFTIGAEKFISKVVNTRNDIVHRGDYKNSFTSIELLLATKIIEFILKLNIMKLLGIDVRKPPDSLFKRAQASVKGLASINKNFV